MEYDNKREIVPIVHDVTEEVLCSIEEKWEEIPNAMDPYGYKLISGGIAEAKKLRVSVEKKAKELKKKANEEKNDCYARVDKASDLLVPRLKAIEERLRKKKDAADKVKLDAKEAKAKADRDRVLAAQKKITSLQSLAIVPIGTELDEIEARLEEMKTTEIDESFGPEVANATAIKTMGIASLENTIKTVREDAERKREQQKEAERVAKEKAELEEEKREMKAAEEKRKAEEKAHKEAEEAKQTARETEMRPYIIFIREYASMLKLPDEEYQKELADVKSGAQQHWDHEQKEKADRLEKEEGERKEKERQEQIEEKRKAKEQAEIDAEREQIEADKKKIREENERNEREKQRKAELDEAKRKAADKKELEKENAELQKKKQAATFGVIDSIVKNKAVSSVLLDAIISGSVDHVKWVG